MGQGINAPSSVRDERATHFPLDKRHLSLFTRLEKDPPLTLQRLLVDLHRHLTAPLRRAASQPSGILLLLLGPPRSRTFFFPRSSSVGFFAVGVLYVFRDVRGRRRKGDGAESDRLD